MSERFGNYEIIRKLAAGGMAEVLLAKQKSLGGFERLVCLKRILPHLSGQDEFLKMFQDEARIAANLIHPNVAQIYDISEEAGQYYIAMEYVRGEDLRRVYNQEVNRGNAIAPQMAALVIMGAAAGLDYAHRHASLDGTPLGIVHRDISPQNILVTFDGHVKIIDFGVAKAAGKLNQTRAGVLKGKYSYMSPEQASGDPVDSRTDIFALGITLYEITTGTRLFKRDNELETLHAVVACSVTPPSQIKPGYDADLEQIILKALAYDPDGRYQHAQELERDLERYLLRHSYPTSASALAGYMQDLFAEKLADEALFGGPPWTETATPSKRPTPRSLVTASTPMIDIAGPGDAAEKGQATPAALEDATVVDAPATAATPAPPQADQPRSQAAGEPKTLTGLATPAEWHVERAREVTRALVQEPQADAHSPHVSAAEAVRLQQNADDAWQRVRGQPRAGKSRKQRSGRKPGQLGRQVLLGGLLCAVAALGGYKYVVTKQQMATPANATDAGATALQQSEQTSARDAGESAPSDAVGGSAAANDDARAAQDAAVQTPDDGNFVIPANQAGLSIASPMPLSVTVGGRYVGEAPLDNALFEPGVLHFKLENKQEGLTLWRRLRLAKGAHSRLIIPERKGKLSVQAKPWAWVQRGLYAAEETPVELQLQEGEYTLMVECPDGRRGSRTVQIDAAAEHPLTIDCGTGN